MAQPGKSESVRPESPDPAQPRARAAAVDVGQAQVEDSVPAGGSPSAGPASSRPLWIVTVLLLAASAALWGASQLKWSAELTGSEQVSALVPLALIYLAGIAGVLATSGWPRRGVGVLLALTGFAACWLAVNGAFDHAQGLPARALALLGGLAVVVAGVRLVRSGHKMPRLGAKYQAPAAAGSAKEASGEKEMWRALSDGDDPTL
ncbi:Trp biosynthesis-associated membrane protein [Actinosynnema sp. ALI-1.44]|uniref:Trp biosynthesis-associated membrane protein n=1 Tax=Actinosynnema sp. ALI-1.44 TaxID=1933779 RepID=UPI000A07828A|nr:Trp biosynthesis-associated membrane protein [Actinosynnema sp. ALI-1.44]